MCVGMNLVKEFDFNLNLKIFAKQRILKPMISRKYLEMSWIQLSLKVRIKDPNSILFPVVLKS